MRLGDNCYLIRSAGTEHDVNFMFRMFVFSCFGDCARIVLSSQADISLRHVFSMVESP